MKVIVQMAPTVNGFIARENDDVSFVSETEFKAFLSNMARIGCDIIGSGTYKRALKDGWFPDKRAFHVVMTSNPIKSKWKNVVFTDKSPKQVLKLLEQKGFKEVMIGGGRIVGSFMEQKLVDEIFLDIEPHAFGNGKMLFGDSNFDFKLKLLGIKKFSKNEVQLHYKVLK
jgi:dihydrofolate reductase